VSDDKPQDDGPLSRREQRLLGKLIKRIERTERERRRQQREEGWPPPKS
jgi:hypothetical protein